MSTKVVLLQRVDNLGEMGDVVSVRPGYARNFLLPQQMALRASKENIAYFEAQKKVLQADSDKRKKEAEKLAEKLAGIKVPLVRQASEAGQLFGSVTSRDIAAEVSSASGEKIDRTMVVLNQNFKLIGLFPVTIALHPEVKVNVTVNIARSTEEAEIQAKTGKALIAEEGTAKAETPSEDAALESALEADALEAEKERAEQEKQEEADEAEAKAKSKAKKAAKKAAKAKDEEEEGETEAAEEESSEEE